MGLFFGQVQSADVSIFQSCGHTPPYKWSWRAPPPGTPWTKGDMKSVSQCMKLTFTISHIFCSKFFPRLRPLQSYINLSWENSKMAVEVFLSCMVTVSVNNSLAYDWRNIAKRRLQNDENSHGKW